MNSHCTPKTKSKKNWTEKRTSRWFSLKFHTHTHTQTTNECTFCRFCSLIHFALSFFTIFFDFRVVVGWFCYFCSGFVVSCSLLWHSKFTCETQRKNQCIHADVWILYVDFAFKLVIRWLVTTFSVWYTTVRIQCSMINALHIVYTRLGWLRARYTLIL